MWEKASNLKSYAGNDFKPVFLSWIFDPDCISSHDEIITEEQAKYFADIEDEVGMRLTKEQKNFWIMQYRELGDDIYQEYPSTPEEAFLASRDGTYWAHQYREKIIKKNREVVDLYDENLDVEVTMDLGMNDRMVLGFWQEYNGEHRCIDEYTNSGEGLSHYVNVMFDKPYRIKRVYGPHDLKVRELTSGQSRKKRLHDLGVRNLRVLPKISVSNGIEAVRKMMDSLWIDPEKCPYLIGCFKNYSKEWDDVRGCWKDKPLHNDWSNGADCIRYRAVSLHLAVMTKNKRKEPKGNDFDTDDAIVNDHNIVVDGLAM